MISRAISCFLRPLQTTALVLFALLMNTAAAAPPDRIITRYGELPLSFERNTGQTDASVKFLSRGLGYTLYLTQKEAVLRLGGAHGADLRLRMENANPQAEVEGLDRQQSQSSYFIGNDPMRWRSAVPQFAQVRYRRVYRGIDAVFYCNQHQLEFDFILAPEANPSQIRFQLEGATRMRVDGSGNLVIDTAAGQIRQLRPVVYQQDGSVRRLIAGGYRLLGGNRVAIDVGKYDRSKPLVVDPVLSYSTLIGGTGTDVATGVAVDSANCAYITGYTNSLDFPTTSGAYRPNAGSGSNQETFIAKLTADGTALIYSTYLGGNADDMPVGIAVDSLGSAYVVGTTGSSNFPTTPGAYSTSGNGFVTKINGTGTQLIFSTYLPPPYSSTPTAMAIDGFGNVYVTGYAYSSSFPTTSGAFQTARGDANYYDAYVMKLGSAGTSLAYSTLLGGNGMDRGYAIFVDSTGNAYIVGSTQSTDFPTTPGVVQRSLIGGQNATNAFLTKLNSTGSALQFSTLLGGGNDTASGVSVNGSGEIFVVGWTGSSVFPTTPGAFQQQPSQSCCGPYGFVAKLSPDASSLLFATYLGALR